MELMHRFALAMGLLSFHSEPEKSILLNGLSVGWLGFQTEFTKLNKFGLAMGLQSSLSEAEKMILLNGLAGF